MALPKEYIGINCPKKWKSYFEELLQRAEIQKQLEIDHFTKTHSGLGSWIIYQFLIEKTDFRFDHFNLDEQGVKIVDRKLNIIVQVYFKPDAVFCEYDESNNCKHVEVALSLLEVQKILREKGWKYTERDETKS